jgi:hypothetical protein
MPAKKGFVVPQFAALKLLGEQVRRHPELLLEGTQLCRKVFQILAVPVSGIIQELSDGLGDEGSLSIKLRQFFQGFALFRKARLVTYALLALRTTTSGAEELVYIAGCQARAVMRTPRAAMLETLLAGNAHLSSGPR